MQQWCYANPGLRKRVYCSHESIIKHETHVDKHSVFVAVDCQEKGLGSPGKESVPDLHRLAAERTGVDRDRDREAIKLQ